MRIILISLLFLLLPLAVNAELFMNKPLHEDINLSKISFPEDKEVKELLGDNPVYLNIVMNYIKSLIFNNGKVSKEQQYTLQQTLDNLPSAKKARINEIIEKQLARCNCKFMIIDLSGGDHYLPLKIIKANE